MILQRRLALLALSPAVSALLAGPAAAQEADAPAPAPLAEESAQPPSLDGALGAVPSLVGGTLGQVGEALRGGAAPTEPPAPTQPPPSVREPASTQQAPPASEIDSAGATQAGLDRGGQGGIEPEAPGNRPAGAESGSPAPASAEEGAADRGAATTLGDSASEGEAGGVVSPLQPAAAGESRGTLERIVAVVPWPLDFAIAFLVLLLVWMTARNFGFRRRLAEAERLAMTDGLTGLPNRQDAERWLERLVAGAERPGRPVSIALIDLDHFKAINDDFGHQAGDATLRGVARALRSELRAGDHVGRLGGEEFIAILPDTEPETALGAAERIRERIAAMPRHVDREVTASLGVASIPGDASSLSELMGAADRALYAAKEAGRDRVVWAGGLEPREEQPADAVPA